MNNPSAIPKPKLINPVRRSSGNGKRGNLPYIRFRRRLRRDLFRGM